MSAEPRRPTVDLPVTPRSPGAWSPASQEVLTAGQEEPVVASKSSSTSSIALDTLDPSPHMNPTESARPTADSEFAAPTAEFASPSPEFESRTPEFESRTPELAYPRPESGAAPPNETSAPPAARRPGGDPVKALLHQHRDLCERAVDPLEIAAGLEAHGITDRTAARFRHRDVFALAEEMYARVPRRADGDGDFDDRAVGTSDTAGASGTADAVDLGGTAGTDNTGSPHASVREPAPTAPPGTLWDWALAPLLPGAVCALTVLGLEVTDGQAHFVVGVAGTLGLGLAMVPALGRGPLGSRHHFAVGSRVWICWLLLFLLAGDSLLRAAVMGGPDEPGPVASAPLLALACAVAPGSWCARLFATVSARNLAGSRGLAEFTARVRPLLLAAVLLFLCALGLLLALTTAVLGGEAGYAHPAALGALLFLARLLLARGFTHAPALVLAAVGTGEALALATVFAGRLPGCESLSVPVQRIVEDHGPGPVAALICGTGALVLLLHALRALARASAHTREGGTR
ncbi:hypothetical protein HUT18_24105 [Streptomyces sp. NA04227]|uniref:hypothetical protein n=1 Tax=Streptomyces sp. NA04227 TaxID=2742136 RepID=UPI0015903467|nr:hypothetical protein [Streptomyces sp. NA04227]QKW04972.1 hypothetical protein HUT18_24105 [Streptomyces sp. NA04227]